MLLTQEQITLLTLIAVITATLIFTIFAKVKIGTDKKLTYKTVDYLGKFTYFILLLVIVRATTLLN